MTALPPGHQPEVTVFADRADFYAGGHPHPEDVLPRDVKLPIDAGSGIEGTLR